MSYFSDFVKQFVNHSIKCKGNEQNLLYEGLLILYVQWLRNFFGHGKAIEFNFKITPSYLVSKWLSLEKSSSKLNLVVTLPKTEMNRVEMNTVYV